MALASSAAVAQTPWTTADRSKADTPESTKVVNGLLDYSVYRLDHRLLRRQLAQAPNEEAASWGVYHQIELPMPEGGLQRFRIYKSPIVSGQAAQQLAGFETYAAQGIDDPHAVARLDYGPQGFHAMILTPQGDVMVDPVSLTDKDHYLSFRKRDYTLPSLFRCTTSASAAPLSMRPRFDPIPVVLTTLKTYRLAMNATSEYTSFFGGVANANSAVGTAVNRVTGVYERDFGIRLNMTYVKSWTGADPYSNNNGFSMLSQNQTETDAAVGNANYDIGHVFSTGGGGVAMLRCVGVTGQKARGVTGLPSPVGDPFYIDYVAHEMGHQFGADHSFNSTSGGCGGGNRVASSAYEPGSGSTIMAYAGLCSPQNVQNFSDAYFHTRSYDQIISWRNNAGSGGTSQNTSNNAPTVSAGINYTIPRGTPFRLTAQGSDPDNDPLTYCWEQFNLGTSATTMPIYRSRNPISSPTRFLPQLTTVINNSSDQWEPLPSVDRSLTFRCTVRDNRINGGGSAYGTMVVTVSGNPFSVTSPNTNVTWNGGSTQTVTWNVGGGGVSPNVNILLSTNGGHNYGTGGAILLKANTPNDGSEQIVLPGNVNSNQCRIIVEAASSIFYDMSNTNFTIVPGAVEVAPDAFQVAAGQHSGGSLADLQNSDDMYVLATIWKSPSAGLHTQIIVEGTSPMLTTSGITLRVEGSGTVAQLIQRIEVFNFTTNSWVELETIDAPTSDQERVFNLNTNPSQLIQAGTGKLRMRYSVGKTNPFLPRWSARLDRVRWTVNP